MRECLTTERQGDLMSNMFTIYRDQPTDQHEVIDLPTGYTAVIGKHKDGSWVFEARDAQGKPFDWSINAAESSAVAATNAAHATCWAEFGKRAAA